MDTHAPARAADDARHWPAGLTRVPYWVYQDKEMLAAEQERLFQGAVWNFLALEADIPAPGDWRATQIGTMPVVVARQADGSIAAFENRCAHRGALICFEDEGKAAKDFTCAYHAWRYDLAGNLASVAFQRGVGGKGGMPDGFDPRQHRPRAVRVTTFRGLVFGTLSDATEDFEAYIGPEVARRIRRYTSKPLQVIGRCVEVLPNNWKLYAENVRDTYHASLLHLFFATFKINRLSQKGGVTVNAAGGCHVSETLAPVEEQDRAYDGMRSVDADFQLRDPRLLDSVDEHGDTVQQQITSVFPNFVLAQTRNALAFRHYVPNGHDRTDLHWIYLGYADDTAEMRARRLRQLNLTGPAGYVSLEDGCIGGFVERGAAAAAETSAVVEMGGHAADSQDNRVSESAIRGFWKQYRALMRL
jgi:anthranilate 1,2-dioxygenase large subunit/terephthalate 1,2-dioxygenase oxygenase component alpha subunit